MYGLFSSAALDGSDFAALLYQLRIHTHGSHHLMITKILNYKRHLNLVSVTITIPLNS